MNFDTNSFISAIAGVLIYLVLTNVKKLIPFFLGIFSYKHSKRVDFIYLKRNSFFRTEFEKIKLLWDEIIELEKLLMSVNENETEVERNNRIEDRYSILVNHILVSAPFITEEVYSSFYNLINIHSCSTSFTNFFLEDFENYSAKKMEIVKSIRNLHTY